MSERRNSLSPPSRLNTEDPGAHELDTSDSEEHFSDAHSAPSSESHPTSPIPKTRVERVDDKPAYGEVPGTAAYQMREEDAAPDEIAYVPEPSSAPETVPGGEQDGTPPTPGGQPIPKTVVEESPDTEGSVTHPEIEKKHVSDPHPDVVHKADGQTIVEDDAVPDTPISPTLKTPTSTRARRKSSLALKRSPLSPSSGPRSPGLRSPGDEEGGDGDDFGDDFDDFEEGGDDDADADFGDFDDDGFQEAEAPPPAPSAQASAPPPPQMLSFSIPDFTDLEASEIYGVTESFLDALFPHEDEAPPLLPSISKDNPVFLTPRSASLWSQLVAPPPLQPPDWIRSRIRRLFLVSLGVPVDLDEILPASKQKKLVLPSLHRVSSNGSFRRDSSESRSVSRVRQAHAAPRTSVDSQGNLKPTSSSRPTGSGDYAASPNSSSHNLAAGASGNRRKGPASPGPSFDLTAARQLCATTDEALTGMTDEELKTHVAKLEAMQGTVQEVLEYWQKRTDEKIGDREAFEGVIENLVKHARKVRK